MQIDALINLRGMTSTQAAAFVGEHVETFLRKVREGRRPGPDLVFGPRQRYWLPATLIEAARRKNARIECAAEGEAGSRPLE